MAETITIKKYLDQEGLQTLIAQIKVLDAASLEAAKTYTDNAPFDAAGSAATAETNAKSYADTQVQALAEGQVKTNQEAIAAIVADYLKKADKAELKGAIDALKEYVGTIPESSTAASIVAYIDEKTAGIASDAALEALVGRVTAVENDVKTIKDDYLTSEDKTELSTAISTEKGRAEGVEAGLRTDVDAIKNDYLTSANQTTLEGKIKTAQDKADAAQTYAEGVASDLADEVTARTEADTAQTSRIKTLEDKIVGLSGAMHFKGIVDAVPEDVSTYKEGDVIIVGDKEYVFNGTAFAEFGDVSAQAQAITGLTNRMDTAESDIDTLQTDLDAAEADLATKAPKTELTAEITARTEADSALDTRIKAVEDKFGSGDGSVADMIADAKQEAIDAAATDATTKANQALTDAKKYADDEDAKIEARVDALEADTHTHDNKTVIDGITAEKVTAWDNAGAKAHEHANKTVLDGITSEKVTAWDSAEQNAKGYADTEIAKDRARLDAVETKATANANAVATKAEQSDLTVAVERITTAEAGIAANKSAIESFVAITADEIKAYFA